MQRKLKVAILFGGRSAEHEVSIQSAKNVYYALDKTKYKPVLIGISQQGTWLPLPSFPEKIPGRKIVNVSDIALRNNTISMITIPELEDIDVVFPILHGTFGEDGTVQGFLKLMDLPFVGASVLGSAIGMDKDVMKRLFRDVGLPIVRFITVNLHEREQLSFQKLERELGLPFFVKPANLGSSVGVSKVQNIAEFPQAVEKAFSFDRKILFEQGIDAREIECAVLGNEEKIASVVGEIIPTHDFYDYDAKYLDKKGATLEIPANVTKKQVKEIQEMAIKACNTLNVDGMARVDFFLDKDTQKIYINEINTIPGFTNISMYPKLWEASGLSYTELIDRLIQLALDRHAKEEKLHFTQ